MVSNIEPLPDDAIAILRVLVQGPKEWKVIGSLVGFSRSKVLDLLSDLQYQKKFVRSERFHGGRAIYHLTDEGKKWLQDWESSDLLGIKTKGQVEFEPANEYFEEPVVGQEAHKVILMLNQRGRLQILDLLYSNGDNKIFDIDGVTQELHKRRLHVPYQNVRTAIFDLEEARLVTRQHRDFYRISEKGIALLLLLKNTLKDLVEGSVGNAHVFSAGEWSDEVSSIMRKATKEIHITTLAASAIDSDDYKTYGSALFEDLKGKGVEVRIIASKEDMPEVRIQELEKVGVEVSLVPQIALLHPLSLPIPYYPRIQNLGHLYISDKSHWLYTETKGGKNTKNGIRHYNDPIIAKRLAEIFDSLWNLATHNKKTQS